MMNFSKYKLQEYLSEGQTTENGATASITSSNGGTERSKLGAQNALEKKQMGSSRQRAQSTHKTAQLTRMGSTMEHLDHIQKEKELIKAYESQKSDWRTELNEKVMDGQERENHPFVTVMPTGDENLVQAMKQMGKEIKNKKDHVEGQMKEEVQVLEEKKKKGCKDGYYRDEDGDCVKKKKKKSTIIMGRGWGYGGHHHDDDGEGEDGGGEGGGEGGGDGGGDGGGGGMGEMFDALGDMLIQEKEMSLRDAQKAGMTKGSPKKPIDYAKFNAAKTKDYIAPKTSDKDRAK